MAVHSIGRESELKMKSRLLKTDKSLIEFCLRDSNGRNANGNSGHHCRELVQEWLTAFMG
jgi:hypothetical protein